MPVVEGDPFGGIKPDKKDPSPAAAEVNLLHRRDDVDSSPLAHHHSLGTGRNQASYGDHIHDGKTSKLTAQGSGLTLLNSVGTDAQRIQRIIALLHNVIDFTET